MTYEQAQVMLDALVLIAERLTEIRDTLRGTSLPNAFAANSRRAG